jgi:hypothetical protein
MQKYLGEILLDLGYISSSSLLSYIKKREPLHHDLCKYLTEKGFLALTEFQKAIEYQKKHNTDIASALFSIGAISEAVFYKFYSRYYFSIPKIGEELVKDGLITSEQLETALRIQKDYKIATMPQCS